MTWVNCAQPKDRMTEDYQASGRDPIDYLDDGFDGSLRGQSVTLHPLWPKRTIFVREPGLCDWCGGLLVTYQVPGNSQPGGRACKKTHAVKMSAERAREREKIEKPAVTARMRKRARYEANVAARPAETPAVPEQAPSPVVETVAPEVDPEIERRRAWERRIEDPAWRAANCPRPDKIVWFTREGAKGQLDDMRGKPWFGNTETLSVYECRCGGFHVGNVPTYASGGTS